MAVAKNEDAGEDTNVSVAGESREPGFYVGDNGPYLTADDAQAYIDGHLDGKGKVEEVIAND